MRKDCKYTADEMADAFNLLREMQNNCIEKDTDAYDDPKRVEKCKALEIATYAINKVFWE